MTPGNTRAAIRRIGQAFVAAAHAMFSYETPRDAAAISYFTLIALFPAILVLIALVDAFLGWFELHRRVVQRFVALFPGSRSFLSTNLSEITAPSVALVLSCVVVVIWSSTWIFTFAENAFNRAWGVPRQRTFWESRVRSITLLVVGGTLLLVSAAITAIVSAARSLASARMTGLAHGEQHIINWIWSSILLGAGFLLAILVFWFVYKLMPDRKIPWLEAFSGAVVAAVLWELGSYIFVRLVPYFDYQKIYGQTGAIIAVLVWVYTSNLILLFGANFSAQLYQPAFLDEQPLIPAKEHERHSAEKIRTFPHRH